MRKSMEDLWLGQFSAISMATILVQLRLFASADVCATDLTLALQYKVSASSTVAR